MPVYLDCNATTPLEPAIVEEMLHYLSSEFGNAGSRTHEYGLRAGRAVEKARALVASVVKAYPSEVIFTSGATEANNIAILGLAAFGLKEGRRHIVTTSIEHKAVLEPIEELNRQGFSVTIIQPHGGGFVEPGTLRKAIRDDTLLVSVMHVNNETGVEQPVQEIAQALENSQAYFHVDAAQGFGKSLPPLTHSRIDLISISGHKIYGPKGVGALIARKRGGKRLPLNPLTFGGGQENGLRPGTCPVHLVAALGKASELANKNNQVRADKCGLFKNKLLDILLPLGGVLNGDQHRALPHTVNISFPGIDSEALMVALKDIIAISNGSACTSRSYAPSHVLKAMQLSDNRVKGAVRISWCHMTKEPDWGAISERISRWL